jgi:BirA family biotin operon repressor/biotin-[acetyl-CoA-carboxylase] ligase
MSHTTIAVECVDEIGSTSDELKARAAAGFGGECALLTRRQPGGHGRLGRAWVSIEGNLHLSVLLRPTALPAPGHWSLLAGVALADAVSAILPEEGRLRLKWPNDLLLDGGKLAGILLEAEASATPWLVIGFGVNLAGAPAAAGRPVATLAGRCDVPSPEIFSRILLERLSHWRAVYQQEGFDPVRDAWLAIGHRPGELLVAGAGERRIAGIFRGIGPDGSLLIEAPDGVRQVTAGEVS